MIFKNDMKLIPSPSQTSGPYLHIGLPEIRSVGCIAAPGVPGEAISLTLRLLDGNGDPVPDGMFEIWQADAAGKYNHPEDTSDKVLDPLFMGFGRLAPGADGSCVFETIKPGPIPWQHGKQQAPHLNVSVFGRGLLNRLSTRVYFAGDERNATDPVLALVPADRRSTMMAQPDPTDHRFWSLAVHLSGEAETVFFDV